MTNIKSPTISSVDYPKFGEVSGKQPHPCMQFLSTVGKVLAVSSVVGMVTFAATAAIIPTAIAVASVITAYAIAKIAIAIFRACNRHRYRLAFTPEVNNPNAPALGIYQKADIRVSNHAAESFEWKKTLIASAKKSIELSPNFAGGEYFREVLYLIEKRMDECPELKTHLLVSSDLLEKEDKELLNELKEKFGDRFNFLITDRIYTTDPYPMSEENHVKTLIIDGQYFSTGGTGIHKKMIRENVPVDEESDKSLGAKFIDKTFRDTDVFGFGTPAQTMRNEFFNLYRIWEHRMTSKTINRYFDIEGEKGRCELFHEEEGLIKQTNMKVIVGGPEHRRSNPIANEMVRLINNSRKNINIANLLFNPDKQLQRALSSKKKEGVQVDGLFNGTASKGSAGHYIYALPNRSNYHLFGNVYEYKVDDQLYHKKVATFDDQYSVIGTYNLGQKSRQSDYECVFVFDDKRIAKVLNESLDTDKSRSRHLPAKSLKKTRNVYLIQGAILSFVLGPFFG